ncbi:10 kDa chaperonin [Gracilariopsis chorda]|uniref:10 kDa chaperonin n=1 Tax=Gracilariopsis chorda TaxID=448386 RepID=A0A2V3J3Z5_9FLOR|nr:10 kDa chaperonin [Gracilariopsis chorda]|eukprot:PXF49099.1 10 kDa chaperonin [Gracilariopsis chorda]
MAFLPPVALPFAAAPAHARGAARCRVRKAARASLGALSDRVIVRPDAPDKTSAGGLVLTSSEHSKRVSTGVVVSVGRGRHSPQGVLEAMPFTEGQRVLWKDQLGVETIEVDGEKLLAMRAFSIVATASH